VYQVQYEGLHSIDICLVQSETKKWDMTVQGEIGWEMGWEYISVWVEWDADSEDVDIRAIDAVKNDGKWVHVDITFKNPSGGTHSWEWLFIDSFVVKKVEESDRVHCKLECYARESYE